MAAFPAHGSHRFKWYGEVLCIEYIGIWNAEEVNAYFRELQAVVAARGLARWGRIGDARQWEGGTPECALPYMAISDWYPTVGAVAHAQLYPSQFLQAMADDINRSIARVGPVKQCSSIEEALAWMRTFGLKTENH